MFNRELEMFQKRGASPKWVEKTEGREGGLCHSKKLWVQQALQVSCNRFHII